MASDKKIKFAGLKPRTSPDTTPTGKPRYIFYALDKDGTFRREVHANNLNAAAGVALKMIYKKQWNNRQNVTFLLADKKQAAGRKLAKADWKGKTTASLYPIFEPFKQVVLRSSSSSSSGSRSKPKSSNKTASKSKSKTAKSKTGTHKTTNTRTTNKKTGGSSMKSKPQPKKSINKR